MSTKIDGQADAASSSALCAAAILLQAYDYARDAGVDRWQFAVDRDELQPATTLDLRWLLARCFAEHAEETTSDHDAERKFRRLSQTALPSRVCLVLTDDGAVSLRPFVALFSKARCTCLHDRYSTIPSSHPATVLQRPAVIAPFLSPGDAAQPLSPPHARSVRPSHSETHDDAILPHAHASESSPPETATPPQSRPHWDANLRELRLENRLIKRFRVPAANQELILNVFQEEGWPEYIDDPLPPDHGIDPRHRLQATIKSLNRCQANALIRFHANGGAKVFWHYFK